MRRTTSGLTVHAAGIYEGERLARSPSRRRDYSVVTEQWEGGPLFESLDKFMERMRAIYPDWDDFIAYTESESKQPKLDNRV